MTSTQMMGERVRKVLSKAFKRKISLLAQNESNIMGINIVGVNKLKTERESKKRMNWGKINEMIISIYLIGFLNFYNITKFGISFIYPINSTGLQPISFKNLSNIIFINLFLLLIFSYGDIFNKFYYKVKNAWNMRDIELSIIILTSIIAINVIIMANDLIIIFIALEIYSFTVFLFILMKVSSFSSLLSIFYLLISALSSFIFLLGIYFIYYNTSFITISDLSSFIYLSLDKTNPLIFLGIFIIAFSFLIKLGLFPFYQTIIRLYVVLDTRILLFQLIIPKFLFLFLSYKFFTFLSFSPFFSYFFILIILLSICSIIIGSISGIFKTQLNILMAYSSILNLGFILLALMVQIILTKYNTYYNFNFSEYLFVYSLTTLSLFLLFLFPFSFFFYFLSNSFLN